MIRENSNAKTSDVPRINSVAACGILLFTEAGLRFPKRNLNPDANCMSERKRIPTDGSASFGHNPFETLSNEELPPAPENPPGETPAEASPRSARKNRGRVDIFRVKAGRGGKTVTVVKNFVGIGLPEKEQLAKAMQRACGVGGTVKNGQIEIQGDKREEVARILTEANFRPVFAGG